MMPTGEELAAIAVAFSAYSRNSEASAPVPAQSGWKLAMRFPDLDVDDILTYRRAGRLPKDCGDVR